MKLTTAQLSNVLFTLEDLGLYSEADKFYNNVKNGFDYSEIETNINNLVEAARAQNNFRLANKIELAMTREARNKWVENLAKKYNIDPKDAKAMGELRKTFEGDFGKKGYDLGSPAMPRTPSGDNMPNAARERFFNRSKDIEAKPAPGAGSPAPGADSPAPGAGSGRPPHRPEAPDFGSISRPTSPGAGSPGSPGSGGTSNKFDFSDNSSRTNIDNSARTNIDNSSRFKVKQTQNVDSRDMSSHYTDNSGLKTPALLGALGIMGAGMLGAMGLAKNDQGQIIDKNTREVIPPSQLSRLPQFSMMSKREQAGQMAGDKPREAQQFVFDNERNTNLKNQRDWYNYALQQSGGDKNFANNVISLVKASPELSTSTGGSPRAI